jgi:hypothetical protein
VLKTPIAVPRDRTNQRVTMVVAGTVTPAMPAALSTPKQT